MYPFSFDDVTADLFSRVRVAVAVTGVAGVATQPASTSFRSTPIPAPFSFRALWTTLACSVPRTVVLIDRRCNGDVQFSGISPHGTRPLNSVLAGNSLDR